MLDGTARQDAPAALHASCRPSRLHAALPSPPTSPTVISPTAKAEVASATAVQPSLVLSPSSLDAAKSSPGLQQQSRIKPLPAAAADTAASRPAGAVHATKMAAKEAPRQEPARPLAPTHQKDVDCSNPMQHPSYSDDDDDGDEGSWYSLAAGKTRPWYHSPTHLTLVALLLVAIGMAVTGLLMQFADDEGSALVALHSVRPAYPWLFFFAAFPPLALVLRWFCWKLYMVAEYTAIREELYFLRPLRGRLAAQLFWIILLVWFKVCFTWSWCDSMCDEEFYQQALRVVWRLLVCVALFAAANLVKCSSARLLSYSFYRTAHFAKVREAIEKELYLIRLSQARSTLQVPQMAAHPGADNTADTQQHLMGKAGAWLAERGSTLWQRGSMIFARHPDTTAAEEEKIVEQAAAQAASTALLWTAAPAAGVPAQEQQGRATVSWSDGLAVGQRYSSTDEKSSHGSDESGAAYVTANHQHQKNQQHPKIDREHSFEQFLANRVPSLLGQQVKTAHKAGSKAGSVTSLRMKQSGRSSSKTVSLPGLVAGIDGLLLQPEVCMATMAATRQESVAAAPMTEQELSGLRKALGVHTFGAFVDRYLDLTPKEEAAHLRQVKRFAKGLFWNIKGTQVDRDYLLPTDFQLFFQHNLDAAADAFQYFDRNGDGSITCLELQESAVVMLKERKNIAASIKDTDSVVESLESGIGLLVHFLFLVLYLLVWGVNILQGFTTFSTTVLALTFVFGDSLKEVFESALYLFVQHPFDVGDALWLGPAPGIPTPGTTARVKKIDLMYTVMKHGTGELVYHKNSNLRSALLVNLSRSANKCEVFSLLVDIDTPDEVLAAVEAAVTAHVTNNPQFSTSTKPLVVWRGMEDPCKLRLGVTVTYSFTGEDVRRHLGARSGVLAVVRQELHRLGVKYTVPLQQSSFKRLA